MKPKAICYWLIFVLAAGMMACGGDDADTEAPAAQTPTATSSQPAEPTVTFERNIDFAAEESAIRELYAVYAIAHGEQDVDTLGDTWFKSEKQEDEVFTAWTFWAGTFERNDGWNAVQKAWPGIFRLRGGKMTVDIAYIAIDGRGKDAVLHGEYAWGNQKGNLYSTLRKQRDDWKIRAIDYTGGRNGKQVRDLVEPAHEVGEKIAD